jgi:hypothetical protein
MLQSRDFRDCKNDRDPGIPGFGIPGLQALLEAVSRRFFKTSRSRLVSGHERLGLVSVSSRNVSFTSLCCTLILSLPSLLKQLDQLL